MAKKRTKRQQKARERKAAKRRARQSRAPSAPRSNRGWLRAAADWPLHECLVTKEWREPGAIVQILVSRRSPQGQVAAGVFLVDLGCLGVKNAFGRAFNTQGEYAAELRNDITARQEMIHADLNLAAKIIREGVAYARELGFRPNRDIRDARLVLGDADPDACDEEIPLGTDGKPFFVSGPYDNVDRIMDKLTRKLGPNGFHYMIGIEGPDEVILDEDSVR
jgi:hypothetical protein